jgi:cellulose synthase/poly-beta-1,6-N-acetylglucosamine synthase-like glycosyltransferase
VNNGVQKLAGKSKNHEKRNRPIKVTIGVPAFNEEKTIKHLLRDIINQPMGNCDLQEIIVESSGSTDATNLRVAELIRHDSRIRLISGIKRGGKSSALNAILKKAKGEVVVFIDGDLVLRKGCIKALLRPLIRDETVGIVTGDVLSLVKMNNFFGFASQFIRELHHRLCMHLMNENVAPKVDGSFYAIRKQVLKAFPFYVVSDDEYASCCAQKKGYTIVYVPRAIVYANDPASFRSFIEWQKRMTLGQMYIRKHFNYTVPTTKASVILPVSVRLIGRYWKKPIQILTVIFLVSVSMILAQKTFARNEIPYIYG